MKAIEVETSEVESWSRVGGGMKRACTEEGTFEGWVVGAGGMTGGAVNPDWPQTASEPLVAHDFLNTRDYDIHSSLRPLILSFTSPSRQSTTVESRTQLLVFQVIMYATSVLRMQPSRVMFGPSPVRASIVSRF